MLLLDTHAHTHAHRERESEREREDFTICRIAENVFEKYVYSRL
jgi:hypothetical protein